jgi:hypothetical protein
MDIDACIDAYTEMSDKIFRRGIIESMLGMVRFKGDLTPTSWNELSRRSLGIKASMKTRFLWTDLTLLARCE